MRLETCLYEIRDNTGTYGVDGGYIEECMRTGQIQLFSYNRNPHNVLVLTYEFVIETDI